MHIQIEDYNDQWPIQFNQIKNDLSLILGNLHPVIEHVGSTSVRNLAAKPIIDILIGLKKFSDLDKTITPMIRHHYLYYEAFNSSMPNRRLFVGLKDPQDSLQFKQIYTVNDIIPHDSINMLRLSHVHIWKFGTHEWKRHIAFRDYLRAHPKVSAGYGKLKKKLGQRSWKHGMEYNNAKKNFIKIEEAKALLWYKKQ